MPTTLRRSILLLLTVLCWSAHPLDAQNYIWNWGRGLASTSNEEVTGVATFSSSGAIYSCGYTEGDELITGTQGNVLGSRDAFLIKLNGNGVREWAFTPSGTGESHANGIALDAAGNIYVTGWFKGTIDLHGMSGLGSGIVISSGNEDWFIASYTPAGALRWRAKLGGSGTDLPTGISVNLDRAVVFGSIRGQITTTFGAVASALPTGKNNLVAAAFGLTGTGQWLISGGSGDDELPLAMTTDDDRVYVAFRAKNAQFRWYGPTGTVLTTHTNTTQKQIRISSFSSSAAHQWTTSLAESDDGSYGMSALSAGCDALYITGITHDPCTFPGVGTVTTGTHDFLYLGRINTANGQFQWVTTGTSTGSHHTTGGTGVAIGKGGAVHLTGNFKEDITIGSTTLTSATGKVQPFVASFRPTGLLVSGEALISSNDAAGRAIDADAQGNFILGGTFETDIACGSTSLTGSSGENGFLFKGQISSVGGNDASSWSPPAPMCSNGPTFDLSSLLTPAASGGATALINSNNVANPGSALGFVLGFYANFNSSGGYVTVDLGTTVPAGSNIGVLWRSQGGSAVAQVSSGTTSNSPTNANGTVTTSSATAVYSSVILSSPARYVRITRPSTGSVGFDVDGVFYAYGNDMSGTWSGAGVSGSTFNPAGLSGPINVTYTVGSGACISGTTNVIQITAAPNAGVNGTLSICSGSPPVALFGQLGGSPQAGGSWSGPSPVVGGMYDPSTMLPGNYNYSVAPTGICTGSASASATVTVGATPSGGTFTGAGAVCPSPASGTLSISGYSGSIVRWGVSTDGGGSWSQAGTNSTSITWTNLSGPTLYRVELSQSGCGTGFSPTVTLTPQDNIAPTLSCPASEPVETAYSNASCQIRVPSFLSYYTASDNCTSTPLLTQTPAAGSMIPMTDATTITISAVDASGITSTTCTATLLGLDTIQPMFTCPADIDLNVGAGACSTNHPVVPIAYTDNCWGSGTAEKTYIISGSEVITPMGTFDPTAWTEITTSLNRSLTAGMHTVAFVHENGVEDIALCSYTVTVLDDQPPVISGCPSDITVTADGSCTATITWVEPTVSDNCGSFMPVQTDGPSSGGVFPIGSTVVRYEATDGTNTVNCAFTVTVDLPPPPTITAGGPTTFCAGGSVVLTSSSATGNVWSNGETTQSISVTSGGTYSVTVTHPGGCSSTSANLLVTVDGLPAIPTISGPSSLCAGASITLSSSSATGNMWSNGANTQSITVTIAGTYSVSVTNGAGCSASSANKVVTTDVSPATPSVSGPSSLCAGSSIILTSSSATGNVWSPDGQTTQSITITAAGIYSVTVTNGANCSATSAQKVISQTPLPQAPNTGTYPAQCPTGPDLALNGTPSAGVWSGTGVSGSMFDPSVGSQMLTYTVSSVGCSNSSTVMIVVGTCDCAGVVNGTGSIDNCGTCVGGTTGNVACTQDCAGVFGGTAVLDNCGTCVGGTTGNVACTQDCAGVFGGTAVLDNCATCVGGTTGNVACTQDCAGVFGGTAVLDNCATCVGGTTGNVACTQDCAGVFGGTAVLDNCGTCVGGTTGNIACTQDCAGVFGGTAVLDNCATCVGGTTGNIACTQDCAGVFGGT
ncbi:MAG: HYR domain-containing protein, partial [Flavobacteriales bacterium]|nr:HYR domain-containing protein [Flavobacteriales bacterium]